MQMHVLRHAPVLKVIYPDKDRDKTNRRRQHQLTANHKYANGTRKDVDI